MLFARISTHDNIIFDFVIATPRHFCSIICLFLLNSGNLKSLRVTTFHVWKFPARVVMFCVILIVLVRTFSGQVAVLIKETVKPVSRRTHRNLMTFDNLSGICGTYSDQRLIGWWNNFLSIGVG